jgi:serine/threonine protein kinase
MGEVYRATDTTLGRAVAIKVLPKAFAQDVERLARFEREAKALAALNHPHIAQIYGLETSSGVPAIVMELVEGEDLSQRIARGPIPLDEALPAAKQIAEALEAAHEQGIIHRDLKPANIKITPNGDVKILDFGLAKLNDSNVPNGPDALSMSPTIMSPTMMTGVGMLLGTAAYMSPEQAKGRAADKRSDIWAFGCVLYEMLTGRRAFEGDDVSDTLAAVLRGEPDWIALPADMPSHLRAIIKTCLVKDRRARIPDISTVRFLIDGSAALATLAPATTDPVADAARSKRTRRHLRASQVVAALLALTTAAGAAAWWTASRPSRPSVTRFFVYAPDNSTFVTSSRSGTSVIVSPDGSKLAFTSRDASGKVLLWVRRIDSLTAQALPSTDGAAFPFWSPDSRFIAYFAQQKLLKIAASGGPPQALCATEGIRGGTWSPDGTIVYNAGPGKTLSRVSSAGGQPSVFMRLTKDQIGYAFPWFLPDGRHFLFYVYASSNEVAGVYVSSLDAAGESTRITGADSSAVYDSHSGHLLFVRQGTLLAQPFDPITLALTGESVPIAERVETGVAQGLAAFSVSTNGILAYGVGAGSAEGQQASWFDRQGKQLEAVGPAVNYRGLDLAPDGTRLAGHRHDGNGGDIWVTDLSRSTTSRFTFDASQENSAPIWSPDGTRIVYASFRSGKSGLYQKPSNGAGTEERLLESDATVAPTSWSPDGRSIIYEVLDPKTLNDLWVLPLSDDRNPFPLLHTPFAETHGQISPDGKWLVYYSNETGRNEVYVQAFPGGAGKWQISTNGGVIPRWRRDGRELFYMSQLSGGKMMAVDIRSSGSTFEAGSPKELFDSLFIGLPHTGILPGAAPYHAFAVSADGQRFLIPHPPSSDGAGTTMPIAVVTNWAAGLEK